MKFVPPVLPSNLTPEQWRWWKKCFAEGLAINEITGDAHKLTFLWMHAGHELFALLDVATSFEATLGILDDQFSAPSRILYARHQLLTCTQKPGECINEFIKQLKLLVQSCECAALSATEHQKVVLCDALVAGITSNAIWARLLELDNNKAGLDNCIALANTIEVSTGYSQNFYSGGVSQQDNNTMLTIVATRNSKTLVPQCSESCFFCGRSRHPRTNCPAKNEVCQNCGKMGHWAKVCRLKTMAATVIPKVEKTLATSILCAAESLSTTKAFYASVSLNGVSNIKALIDPGSTNSFITN